MDTQKPYEVFHSSCEWIRSQVHIVLVRPEYGGNVGSAARALANMGIRGSLRIVGSESILDASAWRMAKHARNRLEEALFFPTLQEGLPVVPKGLTLAATARIGSAHRPHPLPVGTAVERAVSKLISKEITDITLVFGPESDGLRNEEIDLCDWVVTIPSSPEYQSLNLAQAVLIFSHEINRQLLEDWPDFHSERPSQRDKLVAHFVQLAEEVGFVLPEDPYKMRPRLEEILSQLPPYLKEVKTIHGLLDQAIRSVRAGHPEYKGRYRHRVQRSEDELRG